MHAGSVRPVVVHFRLTSPESLTDRVVHVLVERAWITNVTLDKGACLQPVGDLVECDVAREKAGEVLTELQSSGSSKVGGIVITTPTGAPFDAADRLEAAAPGHPDDAVIWEAVEAQAEAGAIPTVSLPRLPGARGGAGGDRGDHRLRRAGGRRDGRRPGVQRGRGDAAPASRWAARGCSCAALRLLVLSFLFAIAVVTLLALLARGRADHRSTRSPGRGPTPASSGTPTSGPSSSHSSPAPAGALALALSKTATMVGVFISVTTVPAAGNLALGLAFWDRSEIGGSAAQLVVNIVGHGVAGAAVLLLMRGAGRG